ncbi:MAG TPA: AprI/Inh family metalloprotease inhibitor [Xanthobacteraceae bacterium]|nr:AprI/Inh family metalloprotease inhibitor [Xanthobacteraceae bacterium]
MIRAALSALALSVAFAAPLAAQAPVPPDEVVTEPPIPQQGEPAPERRTMVGSWEFSNADREKTCTVTFRNDASKVGKRIEFDPACAALFPFVRDIIGWQQAENDFLRLLDGQGHSVLEFSEVENGMFEAPRAGEGILFIQNASSLGPAPKTAEQIAGEWSIVRRTGRAICTLTLTSTAAGDDFAVRVQQPCDAVVTRFAPATWQMDRGEIVLRSAAGQSWRFEEAEDARWHRIPETANPMLMVRK